MGIGYTDICLQAIINDEEYSISPGFSSIMTLVHYQLKIKQHFPVNGQWYKDVGGKDQCIDLTIYLEDSFGNIAKGVYNDVTILPRVTKH